MSALPADSYRAAPLHLRLGTDFFDRVEAAPFPTHELRYRNDRWATRVGLGSLGETEWLQHFAGFAPLPGNLEQPLALRYHGHQFRSYNPDLGDGRGFLFAQLRDARDGRLLDLATKGSGPTPWSRGGDGRLTLKGGVREVLATALLEALGVYTSKSFSLVETGEALTRGDEPSPTRSSVLVRLGHSHIRFGSFQRQAFLKRRDNLQTLVDYSIEHYFRDAQDPYDGDDGSRTLAFLREVVRRSARLAASWMVAGFVHGVLNTDNLNITGESFDYGPYRFLPTLDPGFTAAYFDHSGLYAYGRQPEAVFWNLHRLAESLLPLADEEGLGEALAGYEAALLDHYRRGTLERLGLRPRSPLARGDEPPQFDEQGATFVDDLHTFLHESRIGFERFFFDWYGGEDSADRAARSPESAHYESARFVALRRAFARLEPVPAALAHAYFARDRPCTLLIDEIESIWSAIAERDDWSAFEAKLREIETMREALAAGRSASDSA